MILGLCGLARSGKDTAAAHLVAHHGYEQRAFADPIRSALLALDPLVTTGAATFRLAELVARVGWDEAKAAPDVRRLMQRFGTEVGRAQWGEDFWVQRAVDGLAPGDRVAFTDVRFANEAEAVRRLGGLVVRVVRPSAGLEGVEAVHASEVIDFPVDVHLVNDGTLDDLGRRIDEVLARRS